MTETYAFAMLLHKHIIYTPVPSCGREVMFLFAVKSFTFHSLHFIVYLCKKQSNSIRQVNTAADEEQYLPLKVELLYMEP